MSHRVRVDGVRIPGLIGFIWPAIRRSARYYQFHSQHRVSRDPLVCFFALCSNLGSHVDLRISRQSYHHGRNDTSGILSQSPLPFCFLRFFSLCSGVGRWPCWRVVVAESIKSAWVSSCRWWFGLTHKFSLYCVI